MAQEIQSQPPRTKHQRWLGESWSPPSETNDLNIPTRAPEFFTKRSIVSHCISRYVIRYVILLHKTLCLRWRRFHGHVEMTSVTSGSSKNHDNRVSAQKKQRKQLTLFQKPCAPWASDVYQPSLAITNHSSIEWWDIGWQLAVFAIISVTVSVGPGRQSHRFYFQVGRWLYNFRREGHGNEDLEAFKE